MTNLDAARIRDALPAKLATNLNKLEVLSEVDSTNSFLMQQPAPPAGKTRVAVTDNQTAGRGRYGRTWQSPPGSGLCLSIAYSFATQPANMPALTLATGIGIAEVLHDLRFTEVQLKWPNDLIALDGKLGGILTEAQTQPSGSVTVVTGLGLNVDVGDLGCRAESVLEKDWASRVVDLSSLAAALPCRNLLTARLITRLNEIMVDYEASGFETFSHRWPGHDWLLGREVTVDTATERLTGTAAGVADDGALLVEIQGGEMRRVTSGTVAMAAIRRHGK